MTRISAPVVATLVIAGFVLSAQVEGKPKDKKPDLPKIFDTAQYVYVEAMGGDAERRDTTAEDRAAVDDVETALQNWGRYRLTVNRDEAELVVQVHRKESGNSHIPVVMGPPVPTTGRFPRGPGSGPGSDPSRDPSQAGGMGGPGIGMETGSQDDQLAVYMLNPSGGLNGPIWRQSARNGLKQPPLTLFVHLKQAVEEAYPH